jgi:hypothetical protein
MLVGETNLFSTDALSNQQDQPPFSSYDQFAGIFGGGDILHGSAMVILAMGDGKGGSHPQVFGPRRCSKGRS